MGVVVHVHMGLLRATRSGLLKAWLGLDETRFELCAGAVEGHSANLFTQVTWVTVNVDGLGHVGYVVHVELLEVIALVKTRFALTSRSLDWAP